MRRIALLCVLGSLACTTPAALPQGPAIGEVRHRAPLVPDELDHAAARLAVATLAQSRDGVTDALDALEAAEHALRGASKPSGLVPAGFEAADAVRFRGRAGLAATELLLERDDVDDATRERLSRWLADDPFALAEQRLGDARFSEVAQLFNSVSEPVGKSILTPVLLPYLLGGALVHYTIAFAREDPLPLQRRQALAHWQRLEREYPDAPEVIELAPKIDAYQTSWRATQANRALDLARDALGKGAPDAAWFYARRARRHRDDEAARGVQAEAETRIEAHRRTLAQSLRFDPAVTDDAVRGERAPVLAALAGEGYPSASLDALQEIADDRDAPMARHAAAVLADPVRNPYGAFVNERSAERWRTARWLWFGPLTESPNRGWLGAAEYVIDLPWRIQGAALMPVRLLQWPWRDATPGEADVAVHARRYLEQSPRGGHADEVRDWLESFERERDNWIGTLRVAEGRPDASDAELDVLRERAAEQALAAAKKEPRTDLRGRLLANVARTFPDTRAGDEAGRATREQLIERTAHRVRLSRGFLLENPGVAGPAGLDLAPALLDDDARNGELHPEGVTLTGGRALSIAVLAESGDDDDPPRRLTAQLSEADYARLVAQLEETSFRNSLLDSDDALQPNAQRDVVFERARLGLADDVDERPESEAQYDYRGLRERYGMVRGRESLLPVELVVQGDLSDLQLGAFPRLVPPKTTPDAVLYRE